MYVRERRYIYIYIKRYISDKAILPSSLQRESTETPMGKNCVKSKNLTKVAEKHLCRSFFFNKVARLQPETL